ncbi:Uncharacterised protein [uncultured archaeon]|nr:Uncharacterised protein [uncultured archaeon]
MNNLFIDDRAIELMKKALVSENAQAIRIFTGGGGCCKRFELVPVNKALAGDVTFRKGGVTFNIEKEIADNTVSLWIKFDEQKRLLIEFE